MRLLLTFVTGMSLLGSCSYGAPDIAPPPDAASGVAGATMPTYERDIKPLLADHCFVCHSSPPKRGAPPSFRLDRYEDDPQTDVQGAKSMAGLVYSVVLQNRMPPAAKDGDGVGPNGRRLLNDWQSSGAPP